jgi:hypothetical protein
MKMLKKTIKKPISQKWKLQEKEEELNELKKPNENDK